MCEKNSEAIQPDKDECRNEKLEGIEALVGCSGPDKEPSVKSFIGAKVINAEPMDVVDFKKEKGEAYEGENAPGYKVYYPDGYTSWSPKNVFEEAYRPISGKEKKMIIW